MNRISRRLLASMLTICLTSGMCVTASAFTFPQAYWPLNSAWETAVSTQDADSVISVAQQTYDLLTQYEICAEICYNLEPKSARAAWCAELKGDLDSAILWLQRQRVFADWLDKNEHSYKDTLLNIDARLEYLQAAAGTEIYALTDQAGNSYPGSGAPVSGTWYGSDAGGSQSGESAVLAYITFMDGYSVDYWLGYLKNNCAKFNQAVTRDGVVELAWNFSPENTSSLQQVLSSGADSYIAEGLRAMGNLNATVLLRVGAEMNNWAECDSSVFIQAFQKIARQARQYSNIKMVFSPDNVNNRNVTFEQFYPGDEYVDWIGVSTYHNTNYNSYIGNTPGYFFDAVGYDSDAYYGMGIYDSNPLAILRPLVRFAQEHNKPMMISECGFSYREKFSGVDKTVFATDQLNKFYSYVNMIYPQVKAVFYFDVDLSWDTQTYALSGSSTVTSAYRSAIANNGAYLAPGQAETKTWKPLSQAAGQEDTLKLATYAIFPGTASTTVTYYVDGSQVASTSQAPYYYELDLSALAPGQHTVYAQAVSGQFSRSTPTYTVSGAGQQPQLPEEPQVPTQPEEKPGIQVDTASDWAQDLLRQAYDKNLITDRTSSGFQTQITRLQFAELAVNLIEQVTGQAIAPSSQSFTDTDDQMVLKAVAAGVTSGKGEGLFAPGDQITRQEICVMLNKVIQYVDAAQGTDTLTNPSTQLDAKVTDGDQIDSWAVSAVALLTNNGLMSGKEGGRVAPQDNTQVEEAIVLILALYNKF